MNSLGMSWSALLPLLDRLPGIRKDIENFEVVFFSQVLCFLQVQELDILIAADRAQAPFCCIAAGENDHDILASEAGKRVLATLVGRKGEIRHGLLDDRHLEVGFLGEGRRIQNN
jgi:hypothetical protein